VATGFPSSLLLARVYWGGFRRLCLASSTHCANTFNLGLLQRGVDPQQWDLLFSFGLKTIYTNDDLFLRLDRALVAIR
jgi:hypothetical protein